MVTGRVDGLKKLKPFAVPMLSAFTPHVKPHKAPCKRDTSNKSEEIPESKKHIHLDHSYCSSSNIPAVEHETASSSENEEEGKNEEGACENEVLENNNEAINEDRILALEKNS